MNWIDLLCFFVICIAFRIVVSVTDVVCGGGEG